MTCEKGGKDIKGVTAGEIAAYVSGDLEGDADRVITGVAAIEQAREGDLSFIAQPAYDSWLEKTAASAVLVRKDSPSGRCRCIIRVTNPYLAFVRIARELFKLGEPAHTGIHPSAVIHPEARVEDAVSIGPMTVIDAHAQIGEGTIIGAQSYIGQNTRIGRRCQIGSAVVIEHDVEIHDEVIIQSGSVVGSDGFGYVKDEEGRYYKIPHVGRVVLEERVEIGANCTIDRGTFGETRVRQGTKLDNLIHVAHNVEIGAHTVIAAQTGISGSTKIGNNVVIAGQVGFVGHITIGDGAVFGAQSGVTKSIPPNTTVSGYPAKPHHQAKREEAALRRAPEMLKRLRRLEHRLAEIDPEFAREIQNSRKSNNRSD